MRMTKNFRRILFRSIRSGLTRFLSIFAIVALGCGFLVGLFATCPDMQDTADAYYRTYHTMDLDVKGSAGLTDEDLEALRSLPQVDRVQAGYSYDLVVSDPNGDEVTARTWGFSESPDERCNGFTLKSGRLPENASECVLELPNSFAVSYSVGDVFTVTDANAPEGFLPRSLTVVGIATGPLYMSIEQEPSNVGNGKVSVIFYLQPDAFDLPVYTDALLTFTDTEALPCFSGDYRDLLAQKRAAAEALGETRSAVRDAEIRTEAQAQLQQASDRLETERARIEQEAEENAKQLEALSTELAKQETLLQQANETYLLLYGDPDAYPESVRAALHTLTVQTERMQGAYRTALASAAVRDALAKQMLAQAEEQLDAKRTELEQMSSPRWILFDRTENAGYNSFYSNSEKIGSIAKIFPVFFCLVAALVATTTMTRMVEEERAQAGTLGALGYGRRSILCYYLQYCLLACVPGSVFGIVVGSKLFPAVIWNAYSMMYALPPLQMPFRIGYALGVFAVVCGTILCATFLVSLSTLKECPASLMRPRAPVAGKRILLEHVTFLWKRLSFNRKVTARNLFRYKKRLFMTVIGVAGCSALLLTAFGLEDSIGCIVDRQYDRVQTYQLSVLLQKNAAWQEDPILSDFAKKELVGGMLPIHSESVTLQNGSERISVSLYVPQNETDLEPFLSLHTRVGAHPLSVKDGLILTEKASQVLGVSEGESVTLTDGDGHAVKVTVAGICENYILNFACLSESQYAGLFGKPAEPSCLFVKLQEDTVETRDAVAKELYHSDSVSYLHFNGTVRESFSETIAKLNFVVYVLLFSAAALAMIVLFNLNTINICERKRELATMKVLGFYEPEVRDYVFRETILLTLFGSVCGLLLGYFLHGFVIRTVEMDMVMFGREISLVSYLLSVGVTLLFSLLVSLLSMPALRKINMVDSLKAVE